jgi:hypothetical protein
VSSALYTHPTAAELLQDAIVQNGLANHREGQSLGGISGRAQGQVNAMMYRNAFPLSTHFKITSVWTHEVTCPVMR